MHSATSTSPAATSCVTARAVSRLPMSLAKNPACRLPSASAELISAMTATRVKGPFPRVVGCGPGAGGVVKVWTADQEPCSVQWRCPVTCIRYTINSTNPSHPSTPKPQPQTHTRTRIPHAVSIDHPRLEPPHHGRVRAPRVRKPHRRGRFPAQVPPRK